MLVAFRARNFWSLHDTELEGLRFVTALVGKNGVGKTNLLKCICWAASAALSPAIPRLFGNTHATGLPWVQFELSLRDGLCRYSLEIDKDENRQAVLHETISVLGEGGGWRDLVSRKGSTINLHSRDARTVMAVSGVANGIPLLPVLRTLSGDEVIVDEAQALGKELETALGGIEFYSPGSSDSIEVFVRESQYVEWQASSRPLEGPENVLFNLYHLYKTNQERYEEVSTILRQLGLVERIRFHRSSFGGESDDESSRPGDDVLFAFFYPAMGMAGEGEFFFFDDLSMGTRRAIEIVVAVLQSPATVLLIEQPEDSIHRGLLLPLLDVLQGYRADSQIVFTTHSSVALDLLDPEDIRVVATVDGGTVVRPLSIHEIAGAKAYLEEQGALSEFLDSID